MKYRSPLPVVISVVGHRNPTQQSIDLNGLVFNDDLNRLHRLLPHSPIYMLNGLASGMDLVAAKVFKEFCLGDKSGLDHRLIGVLPKPLIQYQAEISNEYWNLFLEVTQAPNTTTLDPGNCSFLDIDQQYNSQSFLHEIDHCYLVQSLFLLEHSSILFAFTDGVNNSKKGGTSYTVQIAKKQVYSPHLDFDSRVSDYAPMGIVEYFTERISDDSDFTQKFAPRYSSCSRSKLYLHDIAKSSLKVDHINRDLIKRKSSCSGGSPLDCWELIDGRASMYKNRYQRGLYLFLAFGFVTAMSLVRPGWQVFGLTMILMSIYYLPWLQSRFREDFIAYRCLAESLLVLEYWSDFGITLNPADLFRTSLHSDLEWVRVALRSYQTGLIVSNQYPESSMSLSRLQDYQSSVERQLQWLTTSIRRQSRSDSRLLWAIGIVYLLGCISSVVFLLASQESFHKEIFDWITETWMALLVILIAFRELTGFQEINARYARSVAQIENSLSAIRRALNSQNSSSCESLMSIRYAIKSIGFEKMDELNDWVSDQLKRSYKP